MIATPDIPRLGWIEEPSPLEPWPGLEAELGLDALSVKRDDLLEKLSGGSKVRKLDAVLAARAYREAARLGGVGGVGSGQLVALVAAGVELGKPVDVHVFPTPVSEHAIENFAYVAPRAASIRAYRDRADLVLRGRRALQGVSPGAVPAGATSPDGMVAMVRAGLELAAQIDGVPPERLYVALGSAGTALGLAAGLKLAGLPTLVHAVSAVEALLRSRPRLDVLRRALAQRLAELGVDGDVAFAPLVVSGAQIGRGYSFPTEASIAAAGRLRDHGLAGEPAYTGKALAQLIEDARGASFRRAIFWFTGRRGPLPAPPAGWRDALPPVLRDALDGKLPPPGPTRRTVLVGAAAAAGLALAMRPGSSLGPDFDGAVLSPAESQTLRAVAEALLPPAPLDTATLDAIPGRVDAFVASLPAETRRELHALLAIVEHGTPAFGAWPRLSSLTPEARRTALERLGGIPQVGPLLVRSVRDLVLLAYYQAGSSWTAIAYPGPLVGVERRPTPYDALRAPPGATP